MEKLLNALRETLAQLGLDENAINAALEEAVAKATTEENPDPSGDPVPPTEEEIVPQQTPEVPVDEVVDALPPSDEVPAEEVPVTEGDVVPPTEEVPQVEPAPAIPPFDPTQLIEQVNTLQSQLDEAVKANEGLLARVSALEEGLKNAGVIDGSNPVTEVGDQLPSAAPTNPTDDVLGSVLNEINPKKHY